MSGPPPVIINGDVALVLVDTRSLTANQSAVVLLSSIQDPGRTITVRDSLGFLSTPQSIILSTMTGTHFADGTSSVQITQPYSYLSVTARDSQTWTVVNTFGFPSYETVANAATVIANTINTSTLTATGFISTPILYTTSIVATSSAQMQGALYASTLVVAPTNPGFAPYATDPGYAAYIQGNLKTYQTIEVLGGAQFTNTISTGGNLSITGNISSLGAFGARGDIMTLGNIYAEYGGGFFRSIEVQSTATISGPARFLNSITLGSNLAVLTSISTPNVSASSMRVVSRLDLPDGKFIQVRPTDLLFSHPITTPGISTNTLYSSNSITTNVATILNTIIAEKTSSFILSSAQIINPAGSLLVSSLRANTATVVRQLSTATVQTSSLVASTLLLSGSIVAPGAGLLNLASITASTLSTGAFSAGDLAAAALRTSSLATSSLFVATSLRADSVGTVSAPFATLLNQGGSITTNTFTANGAFVVSTVQSVSGIIQTPAPTFQILASSIQVPAVSVSSLTTSSITASSITATRLTLGAAPPSSVTSLQPFFTIDSTFPSTNVIVTGGPGNYLTPFTVSNVPPPGIDPEDAYPIEVSFRLNFNGPYVPGYFAYVTGLSLFPNTEAVSAVVLRSINGSNNVAALYGYLGSNQTFSNDPNTGGVPVPLGPTPSSFFHLTGTMRGASAFSLQFLSRSNANVSIVDSNTTITMQNGVLQWPYALNGTTIQNPFNDMSLRSLYYFGSLNFTSDPALKEGVIPADLERCADIIRDIPLVRYKYKDYYLSTFEVRDAHRLGVLATDLERVFPKSISYMTLEGVPAEHRSTIRTVDTGQLEMAHIGATQLLLRRATALTSTVEGLKAAL
jgi:hypothetical protein